MNGIKSYHLCELFMNTRPTPPVPSAGLPDGWSMEQWEEYGWEYYDSLADRPHISSNSFPTLPSLPDSLPENFWTYVWTVLIVIATPLIFRLYTFDILPVMLWLIIPIGFVILGIKFMFNDSDDKSKTILGVVLLSSGLFSYCFHQIMYNAF